MTPQEKREQRQRIEQTLADIMADTRQKIAALEAAKTPEQRQAEADARAAREAAQREAGRIAAERQEQRQAQDPERDAQQAAFRAEQQAIAAEEELLRQEHAATIAEMQRMAQQRELLRSHDERVRYETRDRKEAAQDAFRMAWVTVKDQQYRLLRQVPGITGSQAFQRAERIAKLHAMQARITAWDEYVPCRR